MIGVWIPVLVSLLHPTALRAEPGPRNILPLPEPSQEFGSAAEALDSLMGNFVTDPLEKSGGTVQPVTNPLQESSSYNHPLHKSACVPAVMLFKDFWKAKEAPRWVVRHRDLIEKTWKQAGKSLTDAEAYFERTCKKKAERFSRGELHCIQFPLRADCVVKGKDIYLPNFRGARDDLVPSGRDKILIWTAHAGDKSERKSILSGDVAHFYEAQMATNLTSGKTRVLFIDPNTAPKWTTAHKFLILESNTAGHGPVAFFFDPELTKLSKAIYLQTKGDSDADNSSKVVGAALDGSKLYVSKGSYEDCDTLYELTVADLKYRPIQESYTSLMSKPGGAKKGICRYHRVSHDGKYAVGELSEQGSRWYMYKLGLREVGSEKLVSIAELEEFINGEHPKNDDRNGDRMLLSAEFLEGSKVVLENRVGSPIDPKARMEVLIDSVVKDPKPVRFRWDRKEPLQ